MPKFSHGLICAFDSFLRHAWHGQHRFALSEALHASARMKKHDSSRKGNGATAQASLF